MYIFCRYEIITRRSCNYDYLHGGPKSDTIFNYVNIMSYKLQDTSYFNLYCLDNFNVRY